MVKVKICGFTDPEDVKIACGLGVDMVGAILVPKSIRCVTLEKARGIFAAVKGAAKVAVIMPENPEEPLKIDRHLRPDYLQVHPTIPLDELKKVREKLKAKIIAVVPVPTERADPNVIVQQAQRATEVADILLVDTKGARGGGTGLTHDWGISRVICESTGMPIFLAGGLNPSNVAEAIKTVRPHGVDVATGVESKPGKKDPELMREFIKTAKGVKA
jgi:phosphoribosylanthranilate isomerase